METTLILISEVPPSMELPLERSQPRVAISLGRREALALPAQALAPMTSTISSERSWATLAAAYLMIEVAALGPLLARDFRGDAADGQAEGLEVHLVAGDAARAGRASASGAGRVHADIALGDLAEVAGRAAGAAAAAEAAGDVLALVLQQALGDRPAAVELADQVVLGHLHVGEEGLAERATRR